MSLSRLADAVLADPTLDEAIADARGGAVRALDLTGPAALRPFVVDGLVRAGRTVLAVTATAARPRTWPRRSATCSTRRWSPSTRPGRRCRTSGSARAATPSAAGSPCCAGSRHPGDDATNGPLQVVVAPVRSVLQPQVKGLGDLEPVELAPGDSAPLEDVVRRLADAAYARVDLVEKRGEFAVRGGIVDVFPPTEEHPLRVEFWGDEVEEIRTFAVADQRTLEKVERLWAPPCRELLLTDEVRARAAELAEPHPELVEITDKLADGIAVEGMESLAPALVDEMELLVDLLPADTHVLVLDPERVRTRAHDLVATSEEFLGASWAAAAGGGTAPIDLGAASYRALADVRAHALAPGPAVVDGQPVRPRDERRRGAVRDDCRASTRRRRRAAPIGPAAQPADAYRGDTDRASPTSTRWLRRRAAASWSSTPGHGPAAAHASRCSASTTSRPGWSTTSTRGDLDAATWSPSPAARSPTASSTRPTGWSLLTGDDISGPAGLDPGHAQDAGPPQAPDRPARAQRPATTSCTSSTASAGTSRWCSARSTAPPASTSSSSTAPPSAAARRPALRADRPARPGHPLRRRRAAQRCDRLGGADWDKRKGRARKAVREIAAELIKLYAARQATKGHAFGPDTPWQRELEDAFPFTRDARPAGHDRRGQGRHEAAPSRWTG